MYFIKQILTGFQTPQKAAQTKQPGFFWEGNKQKVLVFVKGGELLFALGQFPWRVNFEIMAPVNLPLRNKGFNSRPY